MTSKHNRRLSSLEAVQRHTAPPGALLLPDGRYKHLGAVYDVLDDIQRQPGVTLILDC